MQHKPRVTFFQRKPRGAGNYSVEFIFNDVRKRLKGKINSTLFISKFESTGVWKRVYNAVEAFLNQNEINHITGDVNYLALFLSKKKTILTILDLVFISASTGLKGKILKYFWLTMPVKKSSIITAISESTKNEILKYANVHPSKIRVIPVAISENYLPSNKPFNDTRPTILQLGTAENKNIPNLILALSDIDCHLEIVGKKNDQYLGLLKNSGISFTYSQNLTDEEIRQKYRDADIVTLISTYEGFGMPILEGQSTGRAVITSNLFSMPEVAGNAACLVDPYSVVEMQNGFQKIINDTVYRKKLINNGFENIKRFDPQLIAEMYLGLYSEISEKNL